MGDNPPCKVGMEKFRSGPEKISGKNFGKPLFIHYEKFI
jgi:hypothetical protein